ncbi:TIGR01212 family radical SAM protein [Caminibacter mediatlanticus TB-2]|uniref:TIGR01212 family radical SAM protein n=1 Tax=Caminibacter mediatlanticus TB-2 TaxID=391592 RepID=A0ABX5VC51_9BACT|nr:TIGR01212 family radical SAM protein [Caminibacter mediatlanticus]QCT95234.1 TIGR01212 family radical SAM protein [Caminibacter mediatlanticus TB-2]
MDKLYTFGKYLKKKFKTKVKKVPISIPGFTCPNIDGTVARGGCVFCENESFSPNFQKEKTYLNLQSKSNPLLKKQLKSLEFQFFNTIPILKRVYGAKKFIVYFQSFTNTYAPFETLKILYEKALSFPDVIGISIGTRTDSITPQTLEYLANLSKKYEVWVEYGIQSSNNETLKRINRGHDFENVVEVTKKTKELGLNVCGHLIFGLPGENQKEMLKSVEDTINLNIDSIKFHPLYVTDNTLLANDYKKGLFNPISEKEYIDTLIKSIKMLPQNISIQRMTAGSENLLAPEWCKNKSVQISHITQALKKAGIKIN